MNGRFGSARTAALAAATGSRTRSRAPKTSQSRERRRWAIAATVPLILSAVAACSGSAGVASDAASAPAGTPVTTSAPAGTPVATLVETASPVASAAPTGAAPQVTVTSSVADGPLTRPVEWIAQVAGPTDMVIDHVDFLLDGKVAWTEHNVPYTFNDDGQLLLPWVLTPGPHQLAVNVVTASGVVASAQAEVTTDRPPVPAALLDRKFVRTVPASESGPAGDWHLRFGADGVIIVDDPWGTGVSEGFHAAPDGTLSLFGPANWIEPADHEGYFCGPDGVVGMHWKAKGSVLTLSSTDHPDPCPGRASVFAGTWTVSP